MPSQSPGTITALRVNQWMPEWELITFDGAQNQARPKPHFYLFSMPAAELRRLSGIYRRSADEVVPRGEDLRIQRKHDPERSSEIRRYVRGGYPWSGLSAAKRSDPENDSLRKPGWLPTAVVVNILQPGDERSGLAITDGQIIGIHDDEGAQTAILTLPTLAGESDEEIPPIEVIDGQHRLFAFEDGDTDIEDYHLPVVAFHGLDISWQAYLFWTINIKPKKINPSLAFDLYPLLREQEWLNSGEVVQVYRESRAQELTEMLWSTPDSPWYKRINMLGGNRAENGPVTQAAFIRSLIASMVKSWSPRNGVGGIFGGTPDATGGLSWSRLQQGAFLVTAWQLLASEIAQTDAAWATSVRAHAGILDVVSEGESPASDPAFSGTYSLLATDQGVRGFQSVINDLCYVKERDLNLSGWRDASEFPEVTPDYLMIAAATLRDQPVYSFLQEVASSLTGFDWRTSGFPNLTAEERLQAAALRGSSGYRELRTRLIRHLRSDGTPRVQTAASLVEI